MTQSHGRRFSVSSWSLHRTLGRPQFYGSADGLRIPTATHNRGALTLLELPTRLAAFGIHTVEICHFHLPSLDASYLGELRASLQAAQVELFSFLIDDGDITHPTTAERDMAWIEQWIEIAGQLGAQRTRVIAGKTGPSPEALSLSAQRLQRLTTVAQAQGIRLMTENWFNTLSTPATIHALFEQLAGQIGLCLDFGNWDGRGPRKYSDLRAIATYAESCHTKAHFHDDGAMDRDDYIQCLEITRAAHFNGPYTLIYSGPDNDEWAGLKQEMEVVQPYLAAL
ncbi:MAG TPA: sugar phosphate isomerase/epimerase [Ktedonosporobacter sp.]|nr:sugar phosphate isomerase/epimerase [Ktedonosporobacter sp.]